MKYSPWVLLIAACFTSTFSFSEIFKPNTHYEICFTPYQNCMGALIHRINEAKESIYVQAFSFTSRPIARALINAKERGVKVLVILDHSQFDGKHFSLARWLIKKGLPVWNDDQLNIAHNKVMVIDRKIVETGSFNYTVSAQNYNSENMLMIEDEQLAERYIDNWTKRMKASKELQYSAPT